MGFYEGRALESRAPRPRAPGGWLPRVARLSAAVVLATALAHLPWDALRHRFAVLTGIQVEGLRYLDAEQVAAIAGLRVGQDLFALDCRRARQALLLHPRIERAQVTRQWPRGVRVRIVERTPELLVRHGQPWELDSAGVLLPPLARGVVADVPLLAGVSFEGVPAGSQIARPEVRRGLAWMRALSGSELQLGGQVSEIDVSAAVTRLILMDGTSVLAPSWPPETSSLSALRVVLADLKRKGVLAQEVDLRFRNQVIVRPAAPATGPAPAAHGPSDPGGARSLNPIALDTGR